MQGDQEDLLLVSGNSERLCKGTGSVFPKKKAGGKQKRARFKQMQAEVLSQLESIRLLMESSGISTWLITGRFGKMDNSDLKVNVAAMEG